VSRAGEPRVSRRSETIGGRPSVSPTEIVAAEEARLAEVEALRAELASVKAELRDLRERWHEILEDELRIRSRGVPRS
jgi:hypothetical protein